MKRLIPKILLIAGIAMLVISFAIPFVQMAQGGPEMGIIGGAGWPTYWYRMRESSLWLTELGALMSIVGAALLVIWRKKG